MQGKSIEGQVARIVTEDELIINVGSDDGVETGMIFAVEDERTQDVKDPVTGKTLGSINRPKARFVIDQVEDKLSLGTARRSGLSGVGTLGLGGKPVRPILAPDSWPEGVRVGDEVYWTGKAR